MREKIVDIILKVSEELNEQLKDKIEINKKETAKLYDKDGILDSLSLVNLIVQLETLVEKEFGTSIVLADETIMYNDNGPFSTVGKLADYILSLISERIDK